MPSCRQMWRWVPSCRQIGRWLATGNTQGRCGCWRSWAPSELRAFNDDFVREGNIGYKLVECHDKRVGAINPGNVCDDCKGTGLYKGEPCKGCDVIDGTLFNSADDGYVPSKRAGYYNENKKNIKAAMQTEGFLNSKWWKDAKTRNAKWFKNRAEPGNQTFETRARREKYLAAINYWDEIGNPNSCQSFLNSFSDCWRGCHNSQVSQVEPLTIANSVPVIQWEKLKGFLEEDPAVRPGGQEAVQPKGESPPQRVLLRRRLGAIPPPGAHDTLPELEEVHSPSLLTTGGIATALLCLSCAACVIKRKFFQIKSSIQYAPLKTVKIDRFDVGS